MHVQKIVLMILAVTGIFATFLPWAVTPGLPVADGTAGAGWITAGIYLVILLIIVSGSFKMRLSVFSLTAINLFALLNSIYGLILINDLESSSITTVKNMGTTAGFGLYLLIITGFLVLILGMLLRGRKITTINKDEIQLNITVKENPSQKMG